MKINKLSGFIKMATSCLLACAITFNLLPYLFDFTAEASPVVFYDNTLGKYNESNGILTAVPYENAAFRGWYLKDGTEISINKNLTIENGKTADDYVPVFYNLNMLENAGFEEYAAGENLAGEWNSVLGDASFKITDKAAKSGEKSLEITPYNSAFYYNLNNLKANTQYIIKFNYKADTGMKFISVVSGDTAVNNYANLYTGEFIASSSQSELENGFSADAWNQVAITFFTANNTSVKLAMLYEGDSLLVDDMALLKDTMAAPTYFNNEFQNYNSQSGADNTYLGFTHSKPQYTKAVVTEDGRLKVTSTRNTNIMTSNAILFKKGAKYTFNAVVDISEFKYEYVPKLDSEGNQVFDENGNMVYEQVTSNGKLVDMVNWINFSFSIKKGSFGSAADDSYVTSNDEENPPQIVVTNESGKVLISKTNKYSGKMVEL